MSREASARTGASLEAEMDGRAASDGATFPVTHSICSADALADALGTIYRLPTPLTCRFLRRGFHDTYLLSARGTRYVARVYRAEQGDSAIAYELELLVHLASRDVSVSAPVRTVDGHFDTILNAPEGRRNVVLFTYASGRGLSWNREESRQAGKLLAAIHLESEGFGTAHARAPLDTTHLIDRPLVTLRPFLEEKRPQDWNYLVGVANLLRTAMTSFEGRLEWGPCHGDFNNGNIHVAEDGTLRAFDFDFCGPGWRAYDLVGAWRWATWLGAEIWEAFLEGYRGARTFADADVAAVRLLDGASRFRSLGLRAANATHRGSLPVAGKRLQRQLEFLRTWDEAHGLGDVSFEPCQHRTLASARTGRIMRAPGRPAGFPVVTSVVHREAVRTEVERLYGVGPIETCRLVEPGLNDTYVLSSRGERYVARIYRFGWRSRPAIEYELDLLFHLKAKGQPVSAPLRAADGSATQTLMAPEGERHLALFTYADGRSVPWDEDQANRAGRLLAGLHEAAAGFRSSHARESFDLDQLIDAPLSALRPFLSHRPQDWLFLRQFAGRLRSYAARVVPGLDWGVCHGDFDAHNVHVNGDGAATVFDFDFCGSGWRAFDLVIPKWGALSVGKPEMWDAFLAGYQATRRLPADDVRAISLFQPLRHLWGMGLRAKNVARQGTSSIGAAYLDYRLKAFKAWEDGYLHET